MARRSTQYDFTFSFHISARCINREWFELPMPLVWDVMQRHLHFISHAFEVQILAFVLMGNHFHLLAFAPKQNLSQAMAFFMRETSRELGDSSSRINQTYGGRFFRTNIRTHHYFLNCYKYVYRNPIQAGLAERVEDYPWSTLRGLLGFEHLQIPVVEDTTLFSDLDGTLEWLNQCPKDENWEAVRKALKRQTFKLAKNPYSKIPNELELILL